MNLDLTIYCYQYFQLFPSLRSPSLLRYTSTWPQDTCHFVFIPSY